MGQFHSNSDMPYAQAISKNMTFDAVSEIALDSILY